jgi:hypothetical protein
MRIPWLVIGAALLAACGSDSSGSTETGSATTSSPDPSGAPPTELVVAPESTAPLDDTTTTTTSAPAGQPRYEVWGLVSEHEERGTILCLGPQVGTSAWVNCGEPTYDVVGLDWDALLPDESPLRQTHLLLTGTFDDGRFVLTEQPVHGSPPPAPIIDGLDFSSACDPPPDGWAVRDPATTNHEALEAAVAYANDQPQFGGHWVDRDSMADGDRPYNMPTDDPGEMVLNVRFTGDLHRHEAQIGEIWGGALCVADARYTRAEMEDIERQLVAEVEGAGMSAVHDAHGKVLISVGVVPQGLQAELDERFGEGVVLVTGTFRPVGD